MKTKILILVGIAVCIIMLTAPVLASAGYSKIYGNANEDDVLDMRDVTYIKRVIFGKKPTTTFADANYDGKISMLDIGQTKLIILGKEKKLTLVDQLDRTVTINKPVERVVSLSQNAIRTIVALGEVDILVGVPLTGCGLKQYEWLLAGKAYPQLKELPDVGSEYYDINMELTLTLKPDVIFTGVPGVANAVQEQTGVPVVGTVTDESFDADAKNFEIFRLIGKVIGKENAAEELISYANEELDKVIEVTSEIPDSEKPKVYLAMWTCFGNGILKTPIHYDPVDIAGGMNVAKGSGFGGYSAEVSKEQIIAWNPDIIILGQVLRHRMPDSVSIVDILSDPDLQSINAVKNHKVYYTKGFACGWDPATGLTETFYFAKLFHPEKFMVLDVEKEGNEIFKRFYGVEGLYTEMSEFYELHLE